MKICKDCKHFNRIPVVAHAFCEHEGAKRDPVSGIAFAVFERTFIGNCGEAGKLFEQRIGFFKRIFG